MPDKKKQPQSIQQTAIGDGNIQIVGDNNTVSQEVTNYIPVENEPKDVNHNQFAAPSQNAIGNYNIQVKGDRNFVQQIINFFKLDTEQQRALRNRHIMLGHVENFWVKGILEKSLHGAALLELGIKEDPDAVTYPWAIKREATKETLPSGMPMLEIFQEIGMGRSLLILGAPGSGKTTMLLELTRQLIERAREDVTEPIPVVFNLSSWTEKFTLADWLARELNTIYYVPKKIAPSWVKENKMLLLLDGLDEVKQESRDKCVDAINQFRKENGLTNMAVCSRIHDYGELKARLSFDGAIEIQSLTSKQVDEYLERFGHELAGVRQALENDTVLRDLAETPLFLSFMTLAYYDVKGKDILVSNNIDIQRNHIFDAYIEHIFGRSTRATVATFTRQQTLHYLSWLASVMTKHNIIAYHIEDMQPGWLANQQQRRLYILITILSVGLLYGLSAGLIMIIGLSLLSMGRLLVISLSDGLFFTLMVVLLSGLSASLMTALFVRMFRNVRLDNVFDFRLKTEAEFRKDPANFSTRNNLMDNIIMVDRIKWSWRQPSWIAVSVSLIFGIIGGMRFGVVDGIRFAIIGLALVSMVRFPINLTPELIEKTTYPGQRLKQTSSTALFFTLVSMVVIVLIGLGLGYGSLHNLMFTTLSGLVIQEFLFFSIMKHYSLRWVLAKYKFLPRQLIPFLNYSVSLIFLRRVGGGYIFVHRLLMEHFADMYPADEK